MSYYKTSKFKDNVDPTIQQQKRLGQYNLLMNNPPHVLYSSPEELDEYYDVKIDIEMELDGLIEEK